MDNVASSGRTLAGACSKLLAAGVGEAWSTDWIAHASNAISIAPLLAAALQPLLGKP